MKQKSLLKTLLLLAVMFAGAGSVSAADKWVKTAPADLTTGDIVVIVDQTSGKAMSNNNGTSAPSAIEVTLNSDKSEISFSSEVAATLQWDVTVGGSNDAPTYQFSVTSGNKTNYLYCSSTNNGVKVGNGDRNSFTIVTGGENNGYYLYNKSGSDERYIGCYQSSDWRCYTTINSNIKGNNNAFYKKTAASGPVDPSVTISSETIAAGGTATISGPEGLTMSFESDDETIATVSNAGVVTGVAAGTATITASWNAVTDTYNAGSKEFTVTVVAATTYEKVTNANQLVAGNEYIIVAPDYNRAMGAQDGSIRGYVDVTISNDDKVTITDEEVTVLTLGGTTDAWTFLASDNSLYLALTSSSNALHTSNDPTNGGSQWTVTSDFMLQNNAFTNRVLKYNSGSPRFACYTSGQQVAVLFVKSGSASDSRVEPGFSFSASTAEATLGSAFTAPTFSNPNNVAVTFESTNTSVATVEQDGTINIVAAGTTTIKATSEATDTYLAGEASYTLTVIDPNAPGTVNNPFTVAQAIAATPTTGEVYISGIVSSFYNTSIVGDGSNYRYYISDDGTTTTQLLVYKGKGLDQATFTSADDLKVGDEVVIYGQLITYSNAPEVAAGNYLVSWNRSTTPTVIVNPATVNAPFEGVEDGEGVLSVSYENIPDLISFDIQFCDANGDELEGDAPDWLSVELYEVTEGQYEVYYIIDPNEGEARTAYFKVYTSVGDEEVYSNLVTITQDAYVESTTYTLATTFVSGKHYVIAASTTVRTMAMGGKNASKNYYDAIEASLNENTITVTDNSGIQEFVIYGPNADGNYSIYDPVAEGYLYASSSNSNDLSYQTTNDDNGLWEIDFENETVTAQGSNTRNLLCYNSSNPRFSCYANSQTAIHFYEKDGEATPTESRTLNGSGYATYCSQNALDFTNAEGVTAWAITGVNGDAITFSQIPGKVPAGTGMLLKGAANASVTMTSAAGEVAALSGNLLEGTLVPLAINANEYYGLSGNTFVPVNAGTVPAGKALLPAAAVDGNSRLTFIFEDATGIATIEQSPLTNNLYYNLSGQRVDSPKKGMYIVNGKKVVVK